MIPHILSVQLFTDQLKAAHAVTDEHSLGSVDNSGVRDPLCMQSEEVLIVREQYPGFGCGALKDVYVFRAEETGFH